ncbi:MAG: O-methyltransferase [Tenericutes bacterium HGW-Tenericutes-4]|nr:MAG: O-methyltransferase [Tenericutes bacterium HGW-Tenericutes-4]
MNELDNNNKIFILNEGGICKTLALKKYASENNIPVLRSKTASLLTSLVAIKKPLRILEIGTAIGYSGTLILENAPKEAVLHTIEKDETSVNLAKENFEKLGLTSRVKVLFGDAKDILPNLEEPYDFIFLDGPKAQYINYLPHLLRLLNVDGVLFADNVLYRGLVFSGQDIPHKVRTIVKNLEEFLIEISENNELKTQIIDLEDGVSISVKGN